MGSVAVAAERGVDPTHYPIRDDMGEGSLQRLISELLRPLLGRVLVELGIKAFVGADQFIFYEQYNPRKVVAPDVYVMPGFSPDIEVDCWKTWETGVAPSFALEVVSRDHRKDSERSPVRYAELGAKELVIFDPKFNDRRGRVRWLLYRALPKRGLVKVEATDTDRVYSKSLRLWLRAVGEGPHTRVRLAKGPRGDALIPTADEIAATVEAENARLRAEIARLKRR
jgi:hypothetical protein